jgi:hypothetical protein
MSRAAVFLLVLGLAQMAGDVFHLPRLKAIAAATNASPAPKVFSSVQGLETFSTHFLLEWREQFGTPHSLAITPEVYSRVRGPYNRRNVFGAALAYGPILQSDPRTRSMFQAVVSYALCGDAPLLRELGVPHDIGGPVRIVLQPRPGTSTGRLPLVIAPECR